MDQEYDAGGNYVPMEVRNEMQDEAFDTIRFWFSNVCVSIPVDWFTRATQEEVKAGKRSLDFSDPETYFDLKDVRTGRLISALNQDRGHSEKN